MSFALVYSNRVEVLYEQLKAKLLAAPPFAKKLIVVPSSAMKSWLMQRFAKDLGIAAGFEVAVYFDQASLHLYEEGGLLALEGAELALAIEVELKKKLEEPRKGYFQEIAGYLEQDPERRLLSLSGTLAELFIRYGTYAPRMLADWERTPISHWQQEIWISLKNAIGSWKSPYTMGQLPLKSYPENYFHIFLFAMSFVPSVRHRAFLQASLHSSVHYLLLSPCMAFWSDSVSDKKRIALLKRAPDGQQKELDLLLRDTNPLLANFGQLGKEMAKMMEEGVVAAEEEYDEIEERSLLTAVQRDLLELNSVGQQKKELPSDDISVQVHAAPSPVREVEIVRDQILMRMHRDKSLTPGDFLVMAPDIGRFAPFIREVFEGGEYPLPCQVMDTASPAEHPVIEAFLFLLKLGFGRFAKEDIEVLLGSEAFCNKQRFSAENVATIAGWLEASGVQWGINEGHCAEVLERKFGIGCGKQIVTWEHFSHWVLDAFTLPALGKVELQTTDGVLAGKFLELLEQLQQLRQLASSEEKPLREWLELIRSLFISYFKVKDPAAETAVQIVLSRMERLPEPLLEAKILYKHVAVRFEEMLRKESSAYRERSLSSVRFSSLAPMRAIPAKVIIWMGMDEGAYPRNEKRQPLDVSKGNALADYSPSKADFDRYLFLETILSAREAFVMTYTAVSVDSPDPLPPSLLVTEWLSFLDRAYTVGEKRPSEKCLFFHPDKRFDPLYFSNSSFHNYSHQDYRMALASLQERDAPHAFFAEGTVTVNPPPLTSITLEQLHAFTSNSIKPLLNKTLNMSIKLERQLKSPFNRTALERSRVMKGEEGSPRVLTGAFHALDARETQEALEQEQQFFEEWGISQGSVGKLLLLKTCREPQQLEEAIWQLPAMSVPKGVQELELQQSRPPCMITGVLEGVTKEGLLLKGKKTRQNIAEQFAKILLFLAANEQYLLGLSNRILFKKSGESISLEGVDHASLLSVLTEAYLYGLHNPLLLLSDWLDDLVGLSTPEFNKAMQKKLTDPFGHFYNKEVRWAYPNNAPTLSQQEHETAKRFAHPFQMCIKLFFESKRGKRA